MKCELCGTSEDVKRLKNFGTVCIVCQSVLRRISSPRLGIPEGASKTERVGYIRLLGSNVDGRRSRAHVDSVLNSENSRNA